MTNHTFDCNNLVSPLSDLIKVITLVDTIDWYYRLVVPPKLIFSILG